MLADRLGLGEVATRLGLVTYILLAEAVRGSLSAAGRDG